MRVVDLDRALFSPDEISLIVSSFFPLISAPYLRGHMRSKRLLLAVPVFPRPDRTKDFSVSTTYLLLVKYNMREESNDCRPIGTLGARFCLFASPGHDHYHVKSRNVHPSHKNPGHCFVNSYPASPVLRCRRRKTQGENE